MHNELEKQFFPVFSIHSWLSTTFLSSPANSAILPAVNGLSDADITASTFSTLMFIDFKISRIFEDPKLTIKD